MTESLLSRFSGDKISFTSRDDLRQVVFEYSQSTPVEAQKLEKAFSAHLETLLKERAWCEDKVASNVYASQTTLRGFLWKLLLDVKEIDSESYRRAVEEKGPSSVCEKIKNDSFRTLATDKNFIEKVTSDHIERVLNVFALESTDSRISYVQGMNVLAAPFLYVMTEVDAYHAFSNFIHHKCPLYVLPSLDGVHRGVKLLDACLSRIDPPLYAFLQGKSLSTDIYAFAPVMTFLASQQPLSEVLKLWDFYLAFGVHMNILCILAQLVSMRQSLLAAPSPMKLLQKWPDLQARPLIQMATRFAAQLPADLYHRLVHHPFDSRTDKQATNICHSENTAPKDTNHTASLSV